MNRQDIQSNQKEVMHSAECEIQTLVNEEEKRFYFALSALEILMVQK